MPAPAKTTKPKASTKEMKSKNATSALKKPTRSHPPYSDMINEAITALKERTGSSQIAIAKFMEEKQKTNLPSNFKKLLLVQLKKLVAGGKLVKVKNSFKLPSKASSNGGTASGSSAKAPAVKPKEKKTAASKKVTAATKKVTAAVKTPAKEKKAAAAVGVAKKKTPVKGVKKPKSIKSPVKKVAAKRAKK